MTLTEASRLKGLVDQWRAVAESFKQSEGHRSTKAMRYEDRADELEGVLEEICEEHYAALRETTPREQHQGSTFNQLFGTLITEV